MIGLTYIDRLTLSRSQWCLILGGPLLVVWHPWLNWPVRIAALLVFLNQPIGTDMHLLWRELKFLHRFTWTQSLSEISHRDYLNFQNPIVSYWLSRRPVFVVWQVVFWLCAASMPITPLSLIMMTQPGHDFISYLLIPTSVGSSVTTITGAMLRYGAACITKSTAMILFPVMLYKVQGWSLLPLGMTLLYWGWLSRHHFGRKQLKFLSYLSHSTLLRTRGQGARLHVNDRCQRYHPLRVLCSLLIYLFPVYRTFSYQQVLTGGLLFLTAPNVKYFLLLQ